MTSSCEITRVPTCRKYPYICEGAWETFCMKISTFHPNSKLAQIIPEMQNSAFNFVDFCNKKATLKLCDFIKLYIYQTNYIK